MAEGRSHRLEVNGSARCIGAHWRIDHVVPHLRRRPDHYDLVFKKRAIGIIRMPELGIEYFIQRARLERVRRGETDHVAAKIIRHLIGVTDFRERARRK
jgi:hypothetical protein